MEETILEKLIDNKELYKKYLVAEKKYYKRLGNRYAVVQIDIDLDGKILKNLFTSLAKTGVCFDDYIVCLLKEELVGKEMEKL